ncbi:serine/threonine-protein phosphatase 4 regulatory subunit 2 [Agrilus planipennis]|uniref:Serine/threonine-protein phosphatase 4 regulatory subunit 2 n=1 Tax=Agrilus planipennis TaxID=224129 RepID=A0A7F5R718_AGRPL|nr:serine/threonine-protein phosphatase 4 regulatory subunit 2 [Agrilus planipennis]
MDNPEEILHSLEEFSKLKPKDIPRELEEYLSFVAKTGDPVYQWGTIKSLFREKLINVTSELYESCPSMEIPPCPNVEVFNYEKMKNFILEKLDTFVAAPFTVQRICELLTSPRKEYNRIDKYMRALEKNILVVSTIEPGNRRTENGEGIVNGIESDHRRENQTSNDINVEDIEMEETPWPKMSQSSESSYQETEVKLPQIEAIHSLVEEGQSSVEVKMTEVTCTENSMGDKTMSQRQLFVSIEPINSENCLREDSFQETSVTITAVPAPVQKRRDSIEPIEQVEEEISSSDSQKLQEGEVSIPSSTSTTSDDKQYSEIVHSVSNVKDSDSTADTSENIHIESIDPSKDLFPARSENENTTTSTVEQITLSITDEDKKNDVSSPIKDLNEYQEETSQISDSISRDLEFVISEESSTDATTDVNECIKNDNDIIGGSEESSVKNPLEELPFQPDKREVTSSELDNVPTVTQTSIEPIDEGCKFNLTPGSNASDDIIGSVSYEEIKDHNKEEKLNNELEPANTVSKDENIILTEQQP